MKIRLKVKLIYVISNFSRRLQQGGKYCSLQFVGQLVESRKAHKTLRSAERAPTLSAGRKIAQFRLGDLAFKVRFPHWTGHKVLLTPMNLTNR